jgi:N-methylhydantoinase B/oxoprolinase/acetone carboxylase alpha subunit
MSGNDNTSETVRTFSAATVFTTTMTNNDFDLIVTGATAAVTVNLPDATTLTPGRPYSVVKDAAAFTVTIDPSGAQTINGAATLVLAASAFHGAIFFTDGVAWFVKASY